ncbi:MAG: hypothetical protein AAFU85_21510 [Planctomycetota bacterium]
MKPALKSVQTLLIAFAISLFFTTGASAQMDRVYVVGSNSASAGTVTETSKGGIKLKTGKNFRDFNSGEIRKIVFQREPAELNRGRELAIDGQYEQALGELKGIDPEKLNRDVIRAEADYFVVLCNAKLALSGRGDRNAAIAGALGFARKNSNSYHFFPVAKLLGDLALATKTYDKAIQYYGALKDAPSAEGKIESRYLTGVAYLEKGEIPKAEEAFNDVASVSVNSAQALRLKVLAKAGQAVALARGGKGEEGLKLVEGLIKELNPTDIEMSARVYNAQGASYEASGDIEGAILAYLHTHLMFSGQSDEHAKALGRLVELWPKVGRAERAAEARQELQQRYPGFVN